MKTATIITVFLSIFSLITNAQNDTIYLMSQGQVLVKYNVSKVDSIIFYKPAAYSGNTVIDIDGNIYNTVKIGNQTWIAENLKTTRYADGTPITNISGNALWDLLGDNEKAYCWYNDSIKYKNSHGAYYTWAAAMNGAASTSNIVQGVCPTGWHIPTPADQVGLGSQLGQNGYIYDGSTTGNVFNKVAKAIAIDNDWTSSTVEGSVGNTDYPTMRNKAGYNAYPSGYRNPSGDFTLFKNSAVWPISLETSPSSVYSTKLNYNSADIESSNSTKSSGLTVRCIKD
jgi:uncharacterized protein (TIGR02145 family)